jgi:dTMP kinase
VFITLEGVDGSGKTVQTRRLAASLESQNIECVVTREPGGTTLGEQIRSLLLSKDYPISQRAEMLLYAAARAQHVDEVIRPALAHGCWVLSDRFVDSSIVYQGVGLGLPVAEVLSVNKAALGDVWPDLTIFVDVPPAVAWERLINRRGQDPDRIETRGPKYLERVRDGYLELAARFPERFVSIPGEGSEDEVFARIMEYLKQRGLVR